MLRRFLQSDIAEIRIFSRDEKKQDDMRRRWADPRIKFYIGDVRNEQSLRDAMAGVDFVFHAAALKQVPSCEFFPIEAVRTNALGRRERAERGDRGRRQARHRALHRQGGLSHQRHGHLQGDDGEAGGGQVARGRRSAPSSAARATAT